MSAVQLVFLIQNLVVASVFAAVGWLFVDALAIRIEVKSVFKASAFGLLAIALTLNVVQLFTPINLTQLIFWLQSIGFWLIFAAFILDPHSKLQFLVILAIAALFFFKDHALLAVQAALISTTVLRIAHNTKHHDLIPFGVVFVLIAAGEFFYFLENVEGFEHIAVAGAFLYIFASIALFYWLWQYLIIRFNLKTKLPKI